MNCICNSTKGQSRRTLFAALCVVLLGSCTTTNTINAPDRNFYFEVVARQNGESASRLAHFIKEEMPKKKYTITNHSGLEWPFYKALDLDAKIRKDSLMPPHWYVHKMIPYRKGDEIKRDEFLVRIDLLPRPDTLPNYSVAIFRMDSTGLSLSAETGIHYIDSTEFTSPKSLREVFLKSIIRYSFK